MRLAKNAGPKKSLSGHHRTILGPYLRNLEGTCRQSEKILSSNISSTRPDNMVNFGPLTAESGSGLWGTPANFNVFRILSVLLHGTIVVGVSQTLRR